MWNNVKLKNIIKKPAGFLQAFFVYINFDLKKTIKTESKIETT